MSKSMRLSLGLMMALITGATHAWGGDGVWTLNNNGNWTLTNNWAAGAVANGVSATAWFTNNISTATRTVTIDNTNRTLGVLNVGDADGTHGFVIAASGGSKLIFNTGGGNAQLNQTATSAANTISTPVMLSNSLDIANSSPNTLTLSGAITGAAPALLTLSNAGSGSGGVTISGVISNGAGTVALVQNSGTSRLILMGANGYTGGTTIAAGKLMASNLTGSATGPGAVSVNNGGTLLGNGTIQGEVTLASNGVVSPGVVTGAGSLSVSNLIWQAGGIVLCEVTNIAAEAAGAGVGYDTIKVGGSVTGIPDGGKLILCLDSLGVTPTLQPDRIYHIKVLGCGTALSLDPADVQLDTNAFLAPGIWSVTNSGKSLVVYSQGTYSSNAWVGGSGSWFNETNWSAGVVPQAGDIVTLPVGSYVVTLSNSPPPLASYTQNGGTLFFTNWNTCLQAVEVTINSGRLDHAVCNTNTAPGITNRVYIVATNVTIASNAQINVDARGFVGTTNAYLYGQGPGGGYADAFNYSGAGHGGIGGVIVTNTAGGIYDSTNEPALPGSGGSSRRAGETGGTGGGAVRIDAASRVTINGAVTANGGDAASYAGGGSGGSIWISCQTFAGSSGRISAKGGKGNTYHGGSGGGGRIAVNYNPAAQLGAGLTVGVLFGVGSETQVSAFPSGASGTLYLPDDQILPGRWLSGAVMAFGPAITQLTNTYPRMILVGGGLVQYTVPARLTVTDFLSVTGNVVGYDGVQFATDSTLTVNGSVALTNAMIAFASPASSLTVAGDIEAFNGNLIVRTNLSAAGKIRLAGGSTLYAYSISNRPAVVTCGGDFTVTTNSKFYVYAADTNAAFPDYGALVDVGGNMRISSNSWVYPGVWSNTSSNNTLGAVLFRMASLLVASNAGFNADGAGYSGGKTNWFFHGFGPGGGYMVGVGSAGGGGYGGTGGYFYAAGYYGKPYGSATNSNRHGSGGGLSGDSRRWVNAVGNGGGVIWIQAAGDVTMDGTLRADGESYNAYNGGGSGGGILVQAGSNVTGASWALLSARGGDAVNYNSGGGGGGRIAIWRRMPAGLRDQLYQGTAAKKRIETQGSWTEFAGNTWVTGGTGSVLGTKGTALFLTGIPVKGTVIIVR